MKRKSHQTKAREHRGPSPDASVQDEQFTASEAKEYVLTTVTRWRRRALRTAIHQIGQLILGVMIEDLYLYSDRVYDPEGKLYREARSNAIDAAKQVLSDDETNDYLGNWITIDTFHQFIIDHGLERAKEVMQINQQRQSLPFSFRFDVRDHETPITLKQALDSLTKEQFGWLADRLDGIDVCQLAITTEGTSKRRDDNQRPIRVIADDPSLEALLIAIEFEETQLAERRRRFRQGALRYAREMTP